MGDVRWYKCRTTIANNNDDRPHYNESLTARAATDTDRPGLRKRVKLPPLAL